MRLQGAKQNTRRLSMAELGSKAAILCTHLLGSQLVPGPIWHCWLSCSHLQPQNVYNKSYQQASSCCTHP